MKLFMKSGLLLGLALFAGLAQAAPKVATTLPIAQALAEQLLHGTDIEAVYLPPKRLPVPRIASWLQRKSADTVQKRGPFAAIVTAESIWPAFALYGKARRHNIHVVPVDIATELNEPGARIRRSSEADDKSYFWLAPDNLLVSSQILARDFSRLWPQEASQIQHNQQQLRQQIQRYAQAMEQQLLAQDLMAVCLQSPRLMPLAEATYLPVGQGEGCEADSLTISKTTAKSSSEQTSVWWVDAADKPLKQGLDAWLQSNLKALTAAL